MVIVKSRVNPFYNTALDSPGVLRANAITDVYFCGVSTCWAIQSAVQRCPMIVITACILLAMLVPQRQEQDHQRSLAILVSNRQPCTKQKSTPRTLNL